MEFRDDMKARGIIAKGQGFDSFAKLTGKATQVSQKAADILKGSVPEAEQLSAKVSAAKGAQDILSTVSDLFEKKDLRNKEQVANLIASLEKSGIKGESTAQVMNVLRDKALQSGDEDLARYIETELPKLSQEYDLTQAIGKKGFKEFGQTLEGLGVRGAAYVGRAANKLPQAAEEFKQGLGIPGKLPSLSPAAKLVSRLREAIPGNEAQRGVAIGREAAAQAQPKLTPVQKSRSLYEADSDTLKGISDRLSTSDNDKIKGYSQTLNKALETGNSAMKNAVLFQISQDPKARELINP